MARLARWDIIQYYSETREWKMVLDILPESMEATNIVMHPIKLSRFRIIRSLELWVLGRVFGIKINNKKYYRG